ncbi:hypothetical protein Q9233_008167 [Columba guinea]|nr:hypothetical protein Q9233_008167 [Columba guinea]
MQRDCLSGSSDMDISSQSTTIIHQIFGDFLRSRVSCKSCQAVSDSYEAFLDVPLDTKEAASVTAALEYFVKPEHLDCNNCFKCSKCDKMVAASKRFTVHHAPKVLTVCLKRFGDFTGDKISQVVEYPEYLDLHPYMSQTAREPVLYSLYAVLVHSGVSCHEGHYFCYTKASDGLWYKMDDESVALHDIDTVLRQQAYVLFYVRCSDLKSGEGVSISLVPPSISSFLSHWVAGSKQVSSVAPQGLPHRTKVTPGRQVRTQMDSRLVSRRKAVCPLHCYPHDRVLHSAQEDSSKEEWGFSPSAHCQENDARERPRSRSPHWGNDLGSWVVATTDYVHSDGRRGRTSPLSCDPTHRDDRAAVPSNCSSQCAPAPSAAQEQTQPRQRKRSRSPQQGHDLRSQLMEIMDQHRLARSTRRWRISSPCWDRAPREVAAPVPRNASSQCASVPPAAHKKPQLRHRDRSRSPQRGHDLHSWFVDTTDYDPSTRRRRRRRRKASVPKRYTSGKQSWHCSSDGGRL